MCLGRSVGQLGETGETEPALRASEAVFLYSEEEEEEKGQEWDGGGGSWAFGLALQYQKVASRPFTQSHYKNHPPRGQAYENNLPQVKFTQKCQKIALFIM